MVTLSYSAIKMLRTDPAEYERVYLHGLPRKKENGRQIEGMYLNDLLLAPDLVKDKYVIVPSIPTTEKMLTYIDELSKTVNGHIIINDSITDSEIERLQIEAHARSGYVESLETVKEKAKKYENYFQYCLLRDNKYGISEEQIGRVNQIMLVCGPKLTSELWLATHDKSADATTGFLKGFAHKGNGYISSTNEIYWEQQFSVPWHQNLKANGVRKTIGIRGAMDFIRVNHEKSVVSMIDLKKVENLLEFKNHYKDRFLELQAGVYCKSMQLHLTNIKSKYKIEFAFLVVDDACRSYLFPLKQNTIKAAIKRADDDVDKAFYHISSGRYTLPYEYLTDKVTL